MPDDRLISDVAHPRTVLTRVADHFRFLAQMGCPGLDLSDALLDRFQGLGDQPARGGGAGLDAVKLKWARCRKCPLGKGGARVVFGSGNPRARIMFVGGAPEPGDEKTGEPFSGRSGKLLTKIIQAIGFKRDEVYLCFVLKCRPGPYQNPSQDQIRACMKGLWQQMDMIRPGFVVALGQMAASALLGTDAPLSDLRGRFHDLDGVQLVPTLHPAELLEDASKKRLVWRDMKMLMAAL